ncbi:MAG: hypothetical protein ABIO45_17065 [Burkholderiaceae bacterium]
MPDVIAGLRGGPTRSDLTQLHGVVDAEFVIERGVKALATAA